MWERMVSVCRWLECDGGGSSPERLGLLLIIHTIGPLPSPGLEGFYQGGVSFRVVCGWIGLLYLLQGSAKLLCAPPLLLLPTVELHEKVFGVILLRCEERLDEVQLVGAIEEAEGELRAAKVG